MRSLLAEYEDVFSDGLGTIEGFTATLHISEGAQSKFWKPRPVRFALRAAVKEELALLEQVGVIEKVSSSDWAAPM